jgi:hypothetical protein
MYMYLCMFVCVYVYVCLCIMCNAEKFILFFSPLKWEKHQRETIKSNNVWIMENYDDMQRAQATLNRVWGKNVNGIYTDIASNFDELSHACKITE